MTPLLQASGLSKSFGAVEALRNVSFDLFEGELVAMVGDNGAGKSTVAKILAGALRPDAGSLMVDGHPIEFGDPQASIELGINTVYQDLALVPNLDVTSNVFLGRELVRRYAGIRFLRTNAMRRATQEYLAELEVNIPSVSGRIVGSMSGGQRQAVAVARSAYWAKRLLILDEPTAALGVRESQAVLRLVRRLRDQGLAVLMISHILPHVMELADRALVMRHGEIVADLRGDIDTENLVSLIVGFA
jgi:simple sugar transport system ATP-binding protein